MSSWLRVAEVVENSILVYFAFIALSSALLGLFGLRSIFSYARERSATAIYGFMGQASYKPVSILVPAYNEEKGIVASVQSLLDLAFPEFEVIVTADGPTDRTVEVMEKAFDMVEVPRSGRVIVTTAEVRRVLRSVRHPNLFLVDKANGGKADAINAAFNLARHPLVCPVDADSILDGPALARISRLFSEDERVMAVGGTIRPLNGSVLVGGKVSAIRAPGRWIERIQVLEYARAFFTYRSAWSRVNSLTIISGAFGIFRRSVVEELGGWWTATVADDMEIVFRIHRHMLRSGTPYRIVASPDPVCWTEVPSTMRALRRQRNGWQRGLLEVLLRHKGMVFNPRYGRVGMVAVPYLWIFEAGATYVEAGGYLYIAIALVFGFLNVEFAILFFALAVLYGVLLSQLAMGVETLLLSRYDRASDRLRLFLAAFVEFAGFRQLILWERVIAPFQLKSKRGKFWTEERTGISVESEGPPDQTP